PSRRHHREWSFFRLSVFVHRAFRRHGVLATVDAADIRGLDTARLLCVAELPHSRTRTYQPKLTPLTPSRALHLATVPPERPRNEHVMTTPRLSLRRRRRDLLCNRPDEPRELARNRGRALRFGL